MPCAKQEQGLQAVLASVRYPELEPFDSLVTHPLVQQLEQSGSQDFSTLVTAVIIMISEVCEKEKSTHFASEQTETYTWQHNSCIHCLFQDPGFECRDVQAAFVEIQLTSCMMHS